MQIVVSMLGIEDVTLDAQKRITAVNAANGRVNINLLLLSPDQGQAPTWLDLSLDCNQTYRADAGADLGLFVCATLGDVDGNGRTGIVCAVTRASGAYVLAFTPDADGVLRKRVVAPRVEAIDFIRSISVGDVDGDGRDEILVASRPNGRVVMFSLDGASFAEQVIEENTFGAGTTNAREVLVADADADGRNEILVTTAVIDAEKWGPTPGAILRFSREGADWRREVLEDFGGITHSRMLRVGNVGSSAKTAIVVNEVGIYDRETQRIDPPTRMSLYRKTGSAWRKEAIADIAGAVKSRGFALGDIDGDGENELILGTRAVELSDPSYLYVFKQDADGAWTSELVERSGALGYHHVEAVDMDGDGIAEVLASDDSKGLLKLYKKMPDGGWMTRELLSLDHALFCVSMHAFEFPPQPAAANRDSRRTDDASA